MSRTKFTLDPLTRASQRAIPNTPVTRIGSSRFLVLSSDGQRNYAVEAVAPGHFLCDCPCGIHRIYLCKHVALVVNAMLKLLT